jgi:hypothetical protein
MRRILLIAGVVAGVLASPLESFAQGRAGGGGQEAATRPRPLPSIAERTEGQRKLDGF